MVVIFSFFPFFAAYPTVHSAPGAGFPDEFKLHIADSDQLLKGTF